MASSTLSAFLVGLKTALQARPGLNGVTVALTMPQDLGQGDLMWLVRAPVPGKQEYAAVGRLRRNDSYSIPGTIRAFKAGTGVAATETQFQAAMDRAAAILDELVLQLRDAPPAVGNQTIRAAVTEIEYLPEPQDQGGWTCYCDFTVEYDARVS
jgi:hypothetical protein